MNRELVSSISLKESGDCLEYDFDVVCNRPVVNIGHIHFYPIVKAEVRITTDLPPAGQAGEHTQ